MPGCWDGTFCQSRFHLRWRMEPYGERFRRPRFLAAGRVQACRQESRQPRPVRARAPCQSLGHVPRVPGKFLFFLGVGSGFEERPPSWPRDPFGEHLMDQDILPLSPDCPLKRVKPTDGDVTVACSGLWWPRLRPRLLAPLVWPPLTRLLSPLCSGLPPPRHPVTWAAGCVTPRPSPFTGRSRLSCGCLWMGWGFASVSVQELLGIGDVHFSFKVWQLH